MCESVFAFAFGRKYNGNGRRTHHWDCGMRISDCGLEKHLASNPQSEIRIPRFDGTRVAKRAHGLVLFSTIPPQERMKLQQCEARRPAPDALPERRRCL
jgi:hypothetical protein